MRSIGSDLKMDYTAVGQTTHLAARMEQLASPGATLLTSATLQLAEGYVSVRDISHDRIDDATQHLKVGDQVEAKFIGMDRKGRTLQLSIKAKDEADTAEALAEYNKVSDAASGTTKLGALLREQLNSNKSE